MGSTRSVAEAPPAEASIREREAARRRALPFSVPAAALAAVLGTALVLRLVGIEYGLPFPLLNPDEASIVPRAWHMVHGGGPDPRWFDYPSLLLYVFAPFQAWHAAPSYIDARLVIACLGVGTVAAAWWLGLRAYGRAAAAVAAAAVAVETTHVAYSHMAVTDVPLTLGIAVALALMVTGRIELAGIAAGLACGVKYPGAFLLVPLVVAGWGQGARLARGFALAVVAFAASTPFFFVDLGQATGDAWRVQRRAHEGWLGFEHDSAAPLAFLDRLWSGFGPILALALLGLLVALVRRRRADLVLASFALAYFASLMALHAHFVRYVLPLVPPLAVLAGRVKALVPVALALLAFPLAWSIQDDLRLTRTDTRVLAHEWIDRHLPKGARIAVDPSTASLAGFRVVELELPLPRERPDPRRSISRLERLRIRYALVTGAVADRVLAAAEKYPREARFYRDLATRTRRVYYLRAGGGLAGPWVAVYRLYS